MRRYTHKPPAYRHHQASGQARVRHDGRDYYLRPHGSAASKVAYESLITQIMAGDDSSQSDQGSLQDTATPVLTISELTARYWRFSLGYYVKDCRPTGKHATIRAALRPLRRFYGELPAAEFGPKLLKDVRTEMIRLGWSRRHINRCLS